MIMGKTEGMVADAIVPGPLEQYGPGFLEWLLGRGYMPRTAAAHLRLMAHAGRWMGGEGLEAGGLTVSASRRFLAARLAAGYREPRSATGLRPLLGYLGELGILPAEPPEPLDAAGALISGFAQYLRAERGLAPETVASYSWRVARFVARCAPGGDPGVITPDDVTSAVVAEASGLSAASGQRLACSLRAFLRYCHVRGLVTADVSAAAMGVIVRRTSMLPRGLDRGQVAALLAACDRGERAGRRNYAVILLLARLGLRAGEAARLRLDDISWRSAEIGVRGKGGRHDVLPLPADVGAAVAAWLRDGRPASGFREVFTTVIAPARPLTSHAVSNIVRRGSVRAGLDPLGPHRLRHTAACAMIGAKVPLAGIAQVMRHRDQVVTAVYARAGLDRLRPLARPWPGTPALPEGDAS
jgi:integrase/recombinase XerD